MLRRLAYATSKIVNNNAENLAVKPPRPVNKSRNNKVTESRNNVKRITNVSRTDLNRHDKADTLDTGWNFYFTFTSLCFYIASHGLRSPV